MTEIYAMTDDVVHTTGMLRSAGVFLQKHFHYKIDF